MKCKSAFKLFLFQAIAVFFAEVNTDSTFSRSSYFTTQKNKQLKGYVVKRFDSPSLLSCGQQCVRNDWCTSTNYKMSSKNDSKGTCELNKHDISLIDVNAEFVDQEGVTFSMLLKVNRISWTRYKYYCLTETIQLNHINHNRELNELKIEPSKKSKL